jgi:L-lactate dehydrogenase complex protein LldG
MSSRDTILKQIRQNQPTAVAMPDLSFIQPTEYDDVTSAFLETLAGIGGQGFVVDGLEAVRQLMEEERRQGREVVNAIPAIGATGLEYAQKSSDELETVDTFFMQGHLAVAENASIWVSEADMIHRLLPFICQQLVIVVERKNMVSHMHEAYQRINTNTDGFGVFIAGPSKTADIEQSLVIGAHGPLGLKVYLY